MNTRTDHKPGSPDADFGGNPLSPGKLSLQLLPHINGSDRQVKGLWTLDSGKTIVGIAVSHDDEGPGPEYAKFYYGLARVDQHGRLDKTFAIDGFTFGQYKQPFNAWGGKVAVHSERIYMLGFTQLDADAELPPNHLTLSCFTTEGVLDPDFAVGGHLILRNLPIEEFNGDSADLAIQPDGNIVIGATYSAPGTQSRVSGVLYRITPKGALDRSFNTTGRLNVLLNDGADPTSVNALQLQGDKILIAGGVTQADGMKGYFARYNHDGSVDRTFGEPASSGVYVLDVADSTVHALVKTADDGFLGLGKSGIDRGEDGHQLPVKGLLVGRLADGQPNLHFNRGKPVLTQLGERLGDNWHAGFIDADRRITVVSTHSSVHFGRFLDNGLLDSSFGNNGYVGEDSPTIATPAFLQRRLDNRFVFGGNPTGLAGALGVLWAYWS